MRGFNHKKAVQALTFFAKKEGERINKMKAIKLLWLSDRLHLRQYGIPITNDTYVAMKLGPVASNSRDLLEQSPFLSPEEFNYSTQFIKIVDKYHYAAIADPNFKTLSNSDIETLEQVYNVYGHLSEFQLSNLSHLFPEWQKWENSLQKNQSTRFPIDVKDFFENNQNENVLFNDPIENLNLTKSIYLREG